MLHVHHDEGGSLITLRFPGCVPADLRVSVKAHEVTIGTAAETLHVIPIAHAIDANRAMIQVVGDVVCVVLPATHRALAS
jgi:hypothetical protein